MTIEVPPRVRGKVCRRKLKSVFLRITPACAGKSARRISHDRAREDHPRVCGEKLQSNQLLQEEKGSPPRVRGKGITLCAKNIAIRITPACAGKSFAGRNYHTERKDHPRVCGEKKRNCGFVLSFQGSPPRVRGKDTVIKFPGDSPRITPACAGKSMPCAVRWLRCKDHPRVCGEKNPRRPCIYFSKGSPPRVRGKVSCAHFQGWTVRITPACAGKSSIQPHLVQP